MIKMILSLKNRQQKMSKYEQNLSKNDQKLSKIF